MFDLDEFGAALTVPEHRELYAYWCSKRVAGRLPARGALDPVDIPGLLPWLIVLDVEWSGGEARFRFRVVGTGCVERYGRDATGLWFDEAYEGETLARQRAAYTEVARTAVPCHSRPLFPVPEKNHVTYERLILPLADDGAAVDTLVALMIFH